MDSSGINRGSTVGNFVSQSPKCGTSSSPDAWYTFIGTGALVQLDLCNDTPYDSYLSLYSGSSCNSLDCESYDDDSSGCRHLDSRIHLSASTGQQYSVKFMVLDPIVSFTTNYGHKR
eukprot:TRINITY_DN15628_c0_g1_i1.p1 TRINITY_DN15628_c0_g1~~TRINITY_DN15628_c0_g1_i1.p1  ORF type:complete len:129 (-),score=5.71 TRINITY_DN15628_c0_g1_i1:165-515(-)